MNFERLVDLSEPLRPVGRATAASLVEREFELAQQARYLLTRRDVAEIGPCAESGLVDVIESGQSARKEFAIDHALGEAIDRAEPKSERQFLEPVSHQLLIARSDHGQSVAHYDPVGTGAIELSPLAAGTPHH